MKQQGAATIGLHDDLDKVCKGQIPSHKPPLLPCVRLLPLPTTASPDPLPPPPSLLPAPQAREELEDAHLTIIDLQDDSTRLEVKLTRCEEGLTHCVAC